MQADDDSDGLDFDDEFLSAVSCMSSPTSTGEGRPTSAKSTDYASQFYRNRHSRSSAARSPPCSNIDLSNEDDEEGCSGRDEERRKLLQNNNDQQHFHYPPPFSSPSLSACASELLPLKGRLSSPPELVVEDHSKVGSQGSDGDQAIPSSSSLHLGIPSASRVGTPRRSSSGSGASMASASSNRSSYRSALGDTARSSLINGSLKNVTQDENAPNDDGNLGDLSKKYTSQNYYPFDKWHEGYLRPPVVLHPLQENVLVSLLESCFHYTCGLFMGIPLAILLLAWTCLVVPLRLVFYLITRLTCRGLYRWLYRRDHCDPLWPLGGARRLASGEEDFGDTTLLLATTEGGAVDVAKIRHLLWRRLVNLKDSNGYLSYSKLSSKLRRASDSCLDEACCMAVWTQDTRFDMKCQVTSASCSPSGLNIQTLKDLETYINLLLHEPSYGLNKKRPLWEVNSLTDFGGSGAGPEATCTLLIIRLHNVLTDGCVCPLKFLSLMNDGQLSFDCDPRMRGDDWPQFNLLITASFHLWHAFTVVAAGPMSFLMAIWRPAQKPVWAHSTGRVGRKVGDEESGRCGGAGKRFKSTWARVPQADQLMKLERILRCSIQELLLAFVAGALRRHFRSCGIKHPPDLYASVPVTFRDYMPVGRSFPCHFVLSPVELPLSVDGAIPRIWETQRRLCESLDSAYPRTARCLMRNAGASLPKSWLRSILASTHRSSDGVVCVWRASGELTFADRQIRSLLVYPPLKRPAEFLSKNAWMKYAFTFVQTGNEIVLSLTIDQDAFGTDPDSLLRHFQYEIHGLLSHMSPRMMTLSQATFLPSPLLITRLARSPLKIVHQATTAATAASSSEAVDEEEEQSTLSADSETLEELEQLMTTVQHELQSMKTNPRGNRGDYIAKLAELESKMEFFHHSIVDKLQKREQGQRRPSVVSERKSSRKHSNFPTPPRRASSSSSGGGIMDDENRALLDANFEPILQPLRADADELRTQEPREGAMKLRRKRSRRMDSPTRLSPRYVATSNSPEEGQRQRQRYYSSPSTSEIL